MFRSINRTIPFTKFWINSRSRQSAGSTIYSLLRQIKSSFCRVPPCRFAEGKPSVLPSARELCSLGLSKNPNPFFIRIPNFLWRRESSKETFPQPRPSPKGRMQPLLLSLLHFGKLGPSKVPLDILSSLHKSRPLVRDSNLDPSQGRDGFYRK